MHILQVNASQFGDEGRSSLLTDAFVQAFLGHRPDSEVTRRELLPESMPHLDAGTFQAFSLEPDQRTRRQAERVAFSDRLIDELRRADLVVLGVPMYNFHVPSALKAWFDHVARAGVTFRYTESGPVGLLTGKRAVLACARGGRYAGSDADTQTPWLKTMLSFIGIDRIDFVYAEGLASGDEQSLDRARAQLERLAAEIGS